MKRGLCFSFSTLGCPRAGWDEAARLARLHGFSGIELRALNGSIDLPPQLEETFVTPGGMAGAARDSGVPVVALDTSLRLIEAGEEAWNEVLALAPWADASQIPFLRVFDGGASGAAADPEVRAALRRALETWSALRAKHGFACDLMVEAHWALADPQACVRLGEELEARGRNLHLLWDIGHTWNQAGLEPEKGWALLRRWVRHIHVKDGVREGEKFRHMLPGEGAISVIPLLAALERDGFAGPVSLEWEWMWNPELPPLESALESGRRHGWW